MEKEKDNNALDGIGSPPANDNVESEENIETIKAAHTAAVKTLNDELEKARRERDEANTLARNQTIELEKSRSVQTELREFVGIYEREEN